MGSLLEQWVTRVGTRRDHAFDDEAATRKMHHELARAPIDGRHVLVDPPDHPDAVADLVDGHQRAGSLTYRCG